MDKFLINSDKSKHPFIGFISNNISNEDCCSVGKLKGYFWYFPSRKSVGIIPSLVMCRLGLGLSEAPALAWLWVAQASQNDRPSLGDSKP